MHLAATRCPMLTVGLPYKGEHSTHDTMLHLPGIFLTLSSCPFSALVWGASVKHNPQKVGKDHVMEDEDVIQLVKK